MSDRAACWQRLLAEWERSGLSQAEFCRRRGLKAVTFAWWKRRLTAPSKVSGNRGRQHKRQRDQSTEADPASRRLPPPAPVDFLEVSLPRGSTSVRAQHSPALPPTKAVYELALPGGACLRLPDDFDPERVGRLLRAIVATGVMEHPVGAGGCRTC